MVSDPLNGAVMATRRSAGVSFAASLSFENISHRYHSKETIKGVTLTAKAGEVLCLLGPSGSGKTTLLRIAAGIEMQTGAGFSSMARKFPDLPSSSRRKSAGWG